MAKRNLAKIIDKKPETVEFKRNENGKYTLEFDELPLLLFVSSDGVGTYDQLFVNGTESTTHSAITIESVVGEVTTYTTKKYVCVGEDS